jgi:hypothetical protein
MRGTSDNLQEYGGRVGGPMMDHTPPPVLDIFVTLSVFYGKGREKLEIERCERDVSEEWMT